METQGTGTEKQIEAIFEELRRIHTMVAEDLQGRELPDPVDIIGEEREKRSRQIMDALNREITL